MIGAKVGIRPRETRWPRCESRWRSPDESRLARGPAGEGRRLTHRLASQSRICATWLVLVTTIVTKTDHVSWAGRSVDAL
jgi:hypothetical protein